jgi:hypothetical protein
VMEVMKVRNEAEAQMRSLAVHHLHHLLHFHHCGASP